MKLENIDNMYVAQRELNDCWFASYLMVISYITEKKADYDTEKKAINGLIQEYREFVADPTYDPFKGGMGSDFICKCLNNRYNQSYTNYYLEVKEPALQAAMIQKIKESLSNNKKPVIFGLNVGKNFGHFVVVVGLEGDDSAGYSILYFDPNPQIGEKLIKKILNGNSLGNQPIGDYSVTC